MAWQSLDLRLLGELRVLHDGVEVELPASRKTRALLAYLVATGRSHGRERLCEQFWEGPADPRAALRWSLWKLRPLLETRGTARLIASRTQVGFERRGASVDVLDLRKTLAAGIQASDTSALESADAAFAGEFLAGLDLPECYRFSEWCRAERASLREVQLAILNELVNRQRAAPERALGHARRRLLLDPLREDSHRALIELLLDLGRPAEAREQYARCEELLATQLGSAISRELIALRARLAPARGDAAKPAPVSAAAVPAAHAPSELEAAALAGSAAFSGRARELAWLTSDASPRSAVALVLGAAGEGKTRLLAELARALRERGARVACGRAFEAELLRPYAAWSRALAAVSEQAAQAPTPELVLQLARAQPLWIVLDDVQWLDPASCALLDSVARAEGSPVRLVCAARAGELEDNLAAFRTLRTLERAQLARHWLLEPLDLPATAALLSSLGCDSDSAAHIYAESHGHPLYSIELARARAATGTASQARLDDLIAERLERLPARARELLPWVACCVGGADLATLALATGRDAAELVAAALDLERHQLLRASEQTHEFEHELVRQAVLRRISAPRRRMIQRQLARALAPRLEREPALAGLVAYHASEGGDAELCASACVRAGQECIRLHAYETAEALVTLGRHQASELPEESRIPLDLRLLKLLETPALRKCAVRLRSEIAQLCAEAQRSGLQAELRSGLELLGWVHLAQDPGTLQSDRSSRALQSLSRMYQGNVVQLVDGARCLALLELDIPRAQALFADLEAFGPNVTDTLLYQWGTGIVLRWQGDADAARRALGRAASLAAAQLDPWSEFECRTALTALELELGELTAAEAACCELQRVAASIAAGGSERAFADALAALAQLARGAPEAEARLLQAGLSLERLQASYLLAYFYTEQAQLQLNAGHLAEAERAAERGLEAALTVDRRSEAARAHGLLGLVACGRSQLARARSELEQAGQCGSQFLNTRTRAILTRLATEIGA